MSWGAYGAGGEDVYARSAWFPWVREAFCGCGSRVARVEC